MPACRCGACGWRSARSSTCRAGSAESRERRVTLAVEHTFGLDWCRSPQAGRSSTGRPDPPEVSDLRSSVDTDPLEDTRHRDFSKVSTMATLDRDKALDMALAQIDKQFGKGSVMRLGDSPEVAMKVIPTGSIALDIALGIGGLPRGRVIEVYGPEASGKTTVALHAVANAQAAGGIAAFIDAEHALDPEYARAIGVDTDALLVSQPDTGEQALEIAEIGRASCRER